jgi:hypothetical protein
MSEEIKKLILQLEGLMINTKEIYRGFVGPAYDITEELEKHENAFEAVAPLFGLIEKYPEFDFGAPGPIAHFIEKFYRRGYEELLIDSLQRKPNAYSIFLLHRVINGEEGSKREEYIELLRSLAKNTSLDEDVVEAAQESLEYFE